MHASIHPTPQPASGVDEAQDHEKPEDPGAGGDGEQPERLPGDHQRHCKGTGVPVSTTATIVCVVIGLRSAAKRDSYMWLSLMGMLDGFLGCAELVV